eukprot:6294420-Prymnesium_polylepis.1
MYAACGAVFSRRPFGGRSARAGMEGAAAVPEARGAMRHAQQPGQRRQPPALDMVHMLRSVQTGYADKLHSHRHKQQRFRPVSQHCSAREGEAVDLKCKGP